MQTGSRCQSRWRRRKTRRNRGFRSRLRCFSDLAPFGDALPPPAINARRAAPPPARQRVQSSVSRAGWLTRMRLHGGPGRESHFGTTLTPDFLRVNATTSDASPRRSAPPDAAHRPAAMAFRANALSFERFVPTFDFSVRLGIVGRSSDVSHAAIHGELSRLALARLPQNRGCFLPRAGLDIRWDASRELAERMTCRRRLNPRPHGS